MNEKQTPGQKTTPLGCAEELKGQYLLTNK